MKRIVAFASVVFFCFSAEARKFDYKSEKIATYFRGTFGSSAVNDSAFGNSSGSGITSEGNVRTNLSGEFGVVFSSQNLGLRLGAEILMPRNVMGAVGKDAGGTEMYELNSKILAFMPTANLEMYVPTSPESRIVFGAGIGFTSVSVDNEYRLTAAGNTAFNGQGITDHTESGSARTTTAQAFIGYETLFTDTVTATFDAGYRYAPVNGLKSSKDVTTFTGTYAKDADLKNHDGSDRSMNLGGPYVGMTFKFYIGL